MAEINRYLNKICNHEMLQDSELERVFQIIFAFGATPVQIGAFLMSVASRKNYSREVISAFNFLKKRFITQNFTNDFISISSSFDLRSKIVNVELPIALALNALGSRVIMNDRKSFVPENAMARHNSTLDLLYDFGLIERKKKHFFKKEYLFEECQNEKFVIADVLKICPSLREIYDIQKEINLGNFYQILQSLYFPIEPEFRVIFTSNIHEMNEFIEIIQKIGSKKSMVIYSEGKYLKPGQDAIITKIIDSKVTSRKMFNDGGKLVDEEKLKAKRTIEQNAATVRNFITARNIDDDYVRIITLNAAAILSFQKEITMKNAMEETYDVVRKGHLFDQLKGIIEKWNLKSIDEIESCNI